MTSLSGPPLANFIIKHLKGSAREWFDREFKNDMNPDPKLLMQAIIREFEETRDPSKAYDKYRVCKQTSGQSVQAYLIRKTKLATECDIRVDSKGFIRKVLDDMQEHLREKILDKTYPSSYEELKTLAEAADRSFRWKQSFKKGKGKDKGSTRRQGEDRPKTPTSTNRWRGATTKYKGKTFGEADRDLRREWTENPKAPKPVDNWNWCKFHKRWGKHTRDKCQSNPEVNANAVNLQMLHQAGRQRGPRSQRTQQRPTIQPSPQQQMPPPPQQFQGYQATIQHQQGNVMYQTHPAQLRQGYPTAYAPTDLHTNPPPTQAQFDTARGQPPPRRQQQRQQPQYGQAPYGRPAQRNATTNAANVSYPYYYPLPRTYRGSGN